MNIYAPIILCFIPFVTIFVLFAILVPKISLAKEFIASLAGLLALIPIAIIQFLVPGMRLFGQSKALSILLYSIVFLGLVEECFKALMLFIVGAKEEKLNHWFCYSLLAGMIFGSFESVIYFLHDIQNIGHGVTINLIYLRMFTAVLVHTLCAGLGGFAVYYLKNLRNNIWPLFQAIVLHGLYDYFVSFNSPLKYFSIIVILLCAMDCRVFYLRILEELASKKSEKRKILDPNKTIEMPKNPAIIIPVQNTVKENTDIIEEDVVDEESIDFDQIEQEAKKELKDQKKSSSKKSGSTKTAAKKAPAKKTETKTVVKKSGSTKSAAKKPSASKTSSTKKTAEKKTSAKSSAKSAKKTTTTKSAAKKPAAKKTATKSTAKKPASKGKK
ncbi:MAG: PrsW family intramembrane metalloprotease [Treponema sp.]|nr:PrsW family intramembrane metalloprotease [Treponema sp.]